MGYPPHHPFHNELKKEFQPERMIRFGDAVFAIAIALPAPEIKVPPPDRHTATDKLLLNRLDELLPKFAGFLVSFFVIGWYRTLHHRMFGYVVNYSQRLLWPNPGFLPAIVLMPFSTAFYSEYIFHLLKTPLLLYAGNIIFLGLMNFLSWRCIANPASGLSEGLGTREKKYFSIRSLTIPFIFASVMAVCLFVNKLVAVYIPVLIPLYAPLQTLLFKEIRPEMKKLFVFALASCFLPAATAQPAFVKDSLDAYVQKALAAWHIPGVAVCVVRNGKLDVMKGYGVSEWGTNKKVDENTLFGIGSNTKAFTATALALLEAEKALSLDDKVQKWLPDFKLYDPWVTKEATVRDLLCHRLGFETFQGDFMYFDSDLSKEEVRQKFGAVKPLYGFRSRWGYTNAAFLTAGEVIPKVTGKSWSDFLKERIFTPLGMSRTLTTMNEMKAATNICAAHTVVDGAVKKIPYGRLDNLAPAGSVFSSALDLSKWVTMQLNAGKVDDKVVIPASAIAQTRTPQSILGNGGHPYNKAHFALYGLGWFLEEYSGRKIVSHTGGVNGFVTSVCLVPEEKLGIVVLTNTDANNFYEALRYEIMDAYLGLPYRAYSNVFLQRQIATDKADADWLQKKRDTVAMKSGTDVPLSALAGTYRHPVYGTMTIAVKNEKAIATFEHHQGRYATVEPLGGNRYLAQFNEALYGNKVWPFAVGNGKVKSVTVTVADFVEFTPYEFVKEK